MYKTKLQELCQRRGWELPEYTTLKVGPDHMARFTATVKVKGDVFETPERCKSSKEAQNTAAHIAFEHFNVAPARVNLPIPAVPVTSTVAAATQASADPRNFPVSPLPSSPPIPSPGLVAAKSDENIKSANREAPLQNCEDNLHMYKNQLQQYGQRNSLGFPMYTCEAEGPPHNRRFKSRVSLDGKSYETLEFFTTLKEAEQASAKVACQMLSIDAIQEDGGLYKNLLQEFAQKMGLLCPSYVTDGYGLSHRPVFVSSVEIGSDSFRGGEAFTKKQAEMNAAKVAYFALTEQARAHAKKARSGDKIENTESPGLSNGDFHDSSSLSSSSELEHSAVVPFQPFKVQPTVEGQISPQVQTVVFPRKFSVPVPKNASMKPYSNERFVAYKVKLKPEPNA